MKATPWNCRLGLVSLVLVWCSIQSMVGSDPTDPVEEGRTAIGAGDYEKAMRLLEPLAKNGIPEAQNGVGVLYYEGWGVARDYSEAMKWFSAAADQGHAKGQYNLGRMYDEGKGVDKDLGQALILYRKSAEQGYSLGQSILGAMYATGDGVRQDFAEAARWYRLAAEQGEPEAQRRLGMMLAEGQGIAQDHGQALAWFRRGADQGHAGCQYWLGYMYENGWGVPRDIGTARRWYDAAAAQGVKEARDRLEALRVDGAAIVRIYRPSSFAGGGRSPVIYCDQKELAELHNGRFFSVALEPGHHVIHEKRRDGVSLSVAAGGECFIRLEFSSGSLFPLMAMVGNKQARTEITELYPEEAKNILDPRVSTALLSRHDIASPAATSMTGSWEDQFAIEIPPGWHVKQQPDKRGKSYGVVTFAETSLSHIPIDSGRDAGQQAMEIANKVESGELASFFVDRYPAVQGMTCGCLADTARERLFRIYTGPALGKVKRVIEAPQWEYAMIGGCLGLKVHVRAAERSGAELNLLVYAVSDGEVTYDFTLRNDEPWFEKNRGIFEKVVSSVRFGRAG